MPISLIGGLDEVGYGAWAGPIISVVAVFDEERLKQLPAGVTDSKKTTEKQRSMLYLPLVRLARDVGVGWAWPWEIDTYGVSQALQLCYSRAWGELTLGVHTLIVDGKNRVEAAKHSRQIVEPKADLNHPQVSAASMIAKHFRDTIMSDYGKVFPEYGFENHKGYGAHEHEEAIKKHGLLIDPDNHNRYIHRRLYCRKVMLRNS